MKHRALLLAALVLSLGAASAAPSAFRAEASPTIAVRAGVGGAARPGRWLPVEIAVTAGDGAFRGSVAVEWGGAIARHDVDIAPGSTARVSLLVRTIAATPAVRVTMTTAAGAVAASTESPIAILPVDDPVTLCIGETLRAADCAVRISQSEAPTNWRGFDLADAVVWTGGTASQPEAARAFALWHAARWWQDSGFVDPVVAPFDMDSRLADRTWVSLSAFVAGLLICLALAVWRRAPLVVLTGVPIVIASVGVALVSRSSHDVDIQAASFVHQFAGVPRSLVLMRGDVEHPGTQPLELMPDAGDATLDIVRGLQFSDSTTSADGRALYRRTAGRGVVQRFALNGTIDREWLLVEQRGGALVVENRSPFPLGECQLKTAEIVPLGSIGVGATLTTAVRTAPAPGDAVVCHLPADWMKWSARGSTITSRGSAFVIFHIWPGTASGVPLAAR